MHLNNIVHLEYEAVQKSSSKVKYSNNEDRMDKNSP